MAAGAAASIQCVRWSCHRATGELDARRHSGGSAGSAAAGSAAAGEVPPPSVVLKYVAGECTFSNTPSGRTSR
jgi:hypothetical protein